MNDVGMLMRILTDKSADAINLKISKVGGLTKARLIRDLAVASGIPMNIEDSWGGDIVTSAIGKIMYMPVFAYANVLKYCNLFCSFITLYSSFGPFYASRIALVFYRLQ